MSRCETRMREGKKNPKMNLTPSNSSAEQKIEMLSRKMKLCKNVEKRATNDVNFPNEKILF